MPTKMLSPSEISKTKVDEGERFELWDEQQPGLHVRFSHNTRRKKNPQNKVFYYRYRSRGKQRRLKLGYFTPKSEFGEKFRPEEVRLGTSKLTLSEARILAGFQRARVASDVDPQQERIDARMANAGGQEGTFADLAGLYIKRWAKRHKKPSSVKEDQRQIDADLIPEWGSRPAREISKQDVIRLLDKIVDRGSPSQAIHTRRLLSKMFNFGIQRDLVDSNPALLVPQPATEKPRDRVLDNDEIKRMWTALEDFEPIIAASFKLKLLTAARDTEVRRMKWADIDGDVWTIPGTITKNKKPHRVPLSPQAMTVLDELEPVTGHAEWVLASPSPRAAGKPIGKTHKATERLCDAANLEGFTGHDLRRTAATKMAEIEIEPHIIGQVLNHTDRSVTAQVYVQYSYDKQKRNALEKWGRRVEEIITRRKMKAKVVSIR